MKVIIAKSAVAEMFAITKSPELKMLLNEVGSAFDIFSPKDMEDMQAKKLCYTDVVRKNWSFKEIGEEVILEIDDEIFTMMSNCATGYYAIWTRFVRPVKAIMDVVLDLKAFIKGFDSKFDKFITESITPEPKPKVVKDEAAESEKALRDLFSKMVNKNV